MMVMTMRPVAEDIVTADHPEQGYPEPERAQQHRLNWLMGEGLEFRLECLHSPVTVGTADCEEFAEMGMEGFVESYANGCTELRGGVITSGQYLIGDEPMTLWSYDDRTPADWGDPEWGTVASPSAAAAQGRQLHGFQMYIESGEIVTDFTCLHAAVSDGESCDGEMCQSNGMIPFPKAEGNPVPFPCEPAVIATWWTPGKGLNVERVAALNAGA